MNWRQSTRGAVMFEAALLIALVGTIATLSQIHSTVAQQRALESAQLAAAAEATPDDNALPPTPGYDNRVSISCPTGSPGGSVAITGTGNVDVLNPNCTGIVQFTDPETGKTISMDTKQFQNITSACNQGTKECDKAFGDAGMGGLKPEDAKGFKNIFDVQANRVQAQREVSDIVGGAFHEAPPAIQNAYQQLARPDLNSIQIESIRDTLDKEGVLTGPLKESMDNLAIKNAQLEQLKDMVADGGVVRLDPSDPYAGGVPRTEPAFLGRTTHVEGTVTREPARDTGTGLAEVPGEDAWGTVRGRPIIMDGVPVVPSAEVGVPGTLVDRGSALLGEVKEKVTDLWKWATGVTDGVARDDMYNTGVVPKGTLGVDGTGPFTAEDVAGADSARRALTPATREFADGVFRDQRPVARERAGAPAETLAARLVRERQEAEKRQLEQTETESEAAWDAVKDKPPILMDGVPVVPSAEVGVPGTLVDRGSALLGEVKEKVTDLWKWATGVTDGVARDDMYNVGMVPVGTRVVDGTGPFTAEDVAGVDSARRALTPATREFADGVFRDQRPVGTVELYTLPVEGTGVIDTVRTPAGTEEERAAALRIAREREASDDLEAARDKLAEQGIKFDPKCEEEWEKCNAKGEFIGDKPAERGRGIVVADPDKAAEEARKEAVIKAAEAERARAADAERVAKEKAAADEKLKIERLAQERAAELARQRAAQQPPPQTPPRGGIMDMLGGLLGGGMSPEQKAQLEAACKSGNTNACMQLANGNQQQNPLQSLLGQLGKMLGGGSKGGGSGSGGSGSGQQQAQNTNGCSQYPGTTLQNGTCTCPSGQSWSGSSCAVQNPCATYAGTTYNQQANRCDCPSGQNYDGSRCVAVATADTLKAELSCAPKPPQVQDVDGPIAISWNCTGAAASKGDKFDTGNQMSGSTEIAATLPQGSASSANVTLALTCSKDGVQKVATCVVGVSKPFVALAATPSETTSGKTVKLAWVSGGMRDGDDTCTITSDELPAFRKTGKSGLADTPNITEETTFDLKCTTKGGLTKEASATVRIR